MYLISEEAAHSTLAALEQAGLLQDLHELEAALKHQPTAAVYLGLGPWIKKVNEWEAAK